MNPNPIPGTKAWQPLTPRGVAAFARAPLRRLLLVQLVFALVTAGTAAWFLDTAWCPVVRAAIRRLPAQGEINSGKLNWPVASPQSLAGGTFLSLTVDLKHSGLLRSPADVQVEFGQSGVRFLSLFGEADCAYPAGQWIIAFNRKELDPWWGAWQPPILWMSAGAVVVGLLLTWSIIATIYSFPVWLAGFYANRELSAWGCWKLSGAALLPGALLVTAGLVLYGLGALDLVQLMAVLAAHFVVGWVYAAAGVAGAPKLAAAASAKGNPFAAPLATADPRAAENDSTTRGSFPGS